MPSPLRRAVRRTRRALARRRLSATARAVQDERLTYLSTTKLRQLEQALETVQAEAVPGSFLEAGVALGGSAVLLARAAGAERGFDGYDVFGMIPPPTEADPPAVHERYATIVSGVSEGIGGDGYYGYRSDLEEHVARTLARHGAPVGERVRLHRGLFEDTLHPAAPIALAHIDCDWYEPVRLCLERIHPQLSPGGLVIVDDYHDYGGARRATDEFLAAHADLAIALDHAHLIISRRQPSVVAAG